MPKSQPAWRQSTSQVFGFVRERDLGSALERGISLSRDDCMVVFETEDEARKAALAIVGDAHGLISIDLDGIADATFDDNPFQTGTYVTPIAGRLSYMTSSIPPEAIGEVPKARLAP